MYEEDPLGDLITAIEALGFVRVYEDIEDGFLWFQDPETEQLHFYGLDSLSRYYDVKLYFDGLYPGKTIEQVKNAWHTDLVHWVSGHYKGAYSKPSRIFRDYFGGWNSIRRWAKKSVENGNVIPEAMPEKYVNEKISPRN